jgi:hypothetical protein
MKQYLVKWEIDIYAETAEEAARQALKIQRDPDSIATVFTCKEQGVEQTVDLQLL